MVEVFKTNVPNESHALCIIQALICQFPSFDINFDLEDCDRILRIEGSAVCNTAIIGLLKTMGYEAEVLQ